MAEDARGKAHRIEGNLRDCQSETDRHNGTCGDKATQGGPGLRFGPQQCQADQHIYQRSEAQCELQAECGNQKMNG